MVNDLQHHSRSLISVPVDWPYMISYQTSVVTMSLSCTIFETVTLIYQNFRRSLALDTPHTGVF